MTIRDEIAALPPYPEGDPGWSDPASPNYALALVRERQFYSYRLTLAERLLRAYESACDHSSPRELLEICAEQTRLYFAKREAE